MSDAGLQAKLLAALRRVRPEVTGIERLARLSGGASRETWAFDAQRENGAVPLILRRLPGRGSSHDTANPLATEAALQEAAREAGVPAPGVLLVLSPGDSLGEGFVMERIAGETIARRILRDAEWAAAREAATPQCGAMLARLHRIDPATLPAGLKQVDPAADLARYQDIHDGFGDPRPVMEVAFRWLADNMPAAAARTLVHGDFRNGNLVFGPDGVAAVLDWELAHIADPALDLAWISVPAWRFGELDHPVGGFGSREALFEAYEAAGGEPVDPDRVRFHEIFGTLKWGIMCQMLCHAHLSGEVNSIERAAIGRRVCETELDILMYLDGSMP